jgi:hypothetical protein
MQTLSFEPLIPPALWLALAVAAVVLLVWYAWRRPGGVSRLRWIAILTPAVLGLVVILVVLLNPTWIAPLAPPGGKPLLTILVDATASMATADAADGKSRFHAAARLAKMCTEKLGDRYEVKVATFAGSVKPIDPAALESVSPDGAITDLAAALTESIVESPGEGQILMLLSDGIHNGGGGSASVLEAVRLARALATPIYTHTLGGEPPIQDLAVEFRSPQEVAYIHQKVNVTAVLRQRGYRGATANLVLSLAGKELERRQIALQNETTEVTFQVGQDKAGLYRYELRAEPLPGEVSQTNNTAPLLLRVMDKPVRVLFLEGKPYWDAKFLTRTLLADASLELDSVVRLGENRLLRRTFRREAGKEPKESQEQWQIVGDIAGALADGQMLKTYQIVVLGRDADSFLTEPVLAQLKTWLSREGGSLVCSRGQPTSQVSQRLGQLLPVRWTPAPEVRFRVHLTERGRDLRWFPQVGRESAGATLAQLPTLATTSRAEQPKPLAVVLATGGAGAEAEDPVVAYQPYGTGRVVVVEGAGMWRWAFLPPQQQQHDEVYRSLWNGLTRWLITSGDLLPGQKMLLRSDRITFGSTEPATATLLLREEERKQTPLVELRGDGIAEARPFTPAPLGDEPGTFRVVFGKLPEGRYQIRVAGTPESDAATNSAFDVRSLFDEQLDLKARPDLMARIAQDSGGAVLQGGDPREVLAQFVQHREQSRPVRVQRLAAWDRWWVLVLLFGLWGLSWLLRRSGGLV